MYGAALRDTERTIRSRTTQYRKLTSAVILLGMGSASLALFAWSWRPLLATFALVPLSGSFLLADSVLLARWQRRILREWSQGRLELGRYDELARELQMLPARTPSGMLESLPASSGDAAPDAWPPPLRGSIAGIAEEVLRYQVARAALSLGVQAVVVGSVGVALLRWSAAPLWALLAVPILYLIREVWAALRFRRAGKLIRRSIGTGPDSPGFREAASSLDWSGVPARLRRRILAIPS